MTNPQSTGECMTSAERISYHCEKQAQQEKASREFARNGMICRAEAAMRSARGHKAAATRIATSAVVR